MCNFFLNYLNELGRLQIIIYMSSYYFRSLERSLVDLNDLLFWQNFPYECAVSKQILWCDLIPGQFGFSDKLSLSLIYIPKGVTLPLHAQVANIIWQIISCGQGTKVGISKHHLIETKRGNIHKFISSKPKLLQVNTYYYNIDPPGRAK